MNLLKQKKRDKDRLVANQNNASTFERVKLNHERKLTNRARIKAKQQ